MPCQVNTCKELESRLLLTENELKDSLHKKRLSRRDSVLLLLAVDCDNPKNGVRVRQLARGAGLPEIYEWNLTDILSKAKQYAIKLPNGWILTSTGWDYINSLGVLPDRQGPQVPEPAIQLRNLLATITSQQTANFLREAIACFEGGYYRACVVLSWVGAISLLYDYVVKHRLSAFNNEAQTRDNKWRPAKTNDDLARMKESDFLDIISSPPLSIIGKNVKEELKNNCLQLRNACGHPSSLAFGENKVAAHMEILILNVFQPFTWRLACRQPSESTRLQEALRSWTLILLLQLFLFARGGMLKRTPHRVSTHLLI